MPLIVLIILATILYTLFDIFASRAGNRIDANLSSVIFNGLGAILPLIIYVFYKFSRGTELVATSSSGIIYSVLAGITIALFSILLINIFEKGGLAYVVPLIYGGTVALASLTGWLLFKESVSGLQLLGITIIVMGIALVIFSKMQAPIL
ncbi:MAG: EamA family transporter [Candidatus Liptonbacteria bacterium]|nr:EamA family transporter [Candidatus Liptonbacteria bacterium]